MKVAIITDTHAGARGESLVFNEFFFSFWENTFFPYLQENQIHRVIHLGDVVDRQKYITYVIAHQWRTRFWDRLKDMSIEVDVLVGNHDCPNNKYSNYPNAMSELVDHYDNVKVIEECELQHFDGLPVAYIPWINKTNYQATLDFIEKCPALLAMGHLELKGFEMDRGNVSKFGLDKSIFDNFHRVLSGHYHHRSNDGHIYYLGNPYEITWADWNDPRGFHVFDTSNQNLTFVENPHRMFYKIEYDNGNILSIPDHKVEMKDKIVRIICKSKDGPKAFEAFVGDIQDQQPYILEVEDYSEVVMVDTDAPCDVRDTLSVINESIDTAELNLDKERMKVLMRDLYKEANDHV